MDLDYASILQTHAEVAMALAGFASVAAALGRPLGAVRRQRFLALLFLALTQVLSSLIPIWLAQFAMSPVALWRLSSLVSFSIASLTIVTTVVVPLRKIGRGNPWVINPVVNRALDCVSVLSVLTLIFNMLGFPWDPGFALYYASLLLGLSVGFVLFSDAVLLDDDTR